MPTHPRRWFAFRLRTLFVMVAVLALPLMLVSRERIRIAKRREQLAAAGLVAAYINGQPPWRVWLFGSDDAEYAREIRGHPGTTDSDLEILEGMSMLQWLYLDYSRITDVGLLHLEKLPNLRTIAMRGTRVTESGVERLESAFPNKYWIYYEKVLYEAHLKHLARPQP